MKHHNKHFIGAVSVIVLIIVGVGLLLQNYGGDVIGFSVTGMDTASQLTLPEGSLITQGPDAAVKIGLYSTQQKVGDQSGNLIIIKNNQVTAYFPIRDAEGNLYFVLNDESGEMYNLKGDEFSINPEKIDTGFVPVYGKKDSNNVLTQDVLAVIKDSCIGSTSTSTDCNSYLSSIESDQEIFSAQYYLRTQRYQYLSSQLNIDSKSIEAEQTAVQTYLSSAHEGVKYDVTTGTYSGTFGASDVSWKEDTMYVKSGENTYFSEKKAGKITYYQCTKDDCSESKALSGAEAETAKKTYKEAEKEYGKLEDDIDKQMQICRRKTSDCQLKVGDTVITESVRQQSYMNRIYEEQEQKFRGLVTGYLSKWIDKWLGGWSKGVPSWICQHIFQIEYYKNSGWMAMPGNTSATQLQSTLISHSNTIIIEGEKEEITDSMFRYAYSLKILSNQSVEWTTYLYNSCTQKDSAELFYDYGALGPGEYYAMHYAGAGSQDMIFDCTTEECLYDQACVALSDGSAPVCVSLVHGEGFESPQAGSDYDCAISG